MPAPLESTMFAIIPRSPEVGALSPKVWPHISVIPWVQLGEYRHDVLAEAEDIVNRHAPIELRPGGMETVGGEGHEKPAQMIVSKELQKLHMELLYSLGSFGIMVSHPEWAGHNYRPHITSPRRVLLRPATIESVSVIDNVLMRGDRRGTKQISARLGRYDYEK